MPIRSATAREALFSGSMSAMTLGSLTVHGTLPAVRHKHASGATGAQDLETQGETIK